MSTAATTPRKKKGKHETRYRMWQMGIACVAAGSRWDVAALEFAAQVSKVERYGVCV